MQLQQIADWLKCPGVFSQTVRDFQQDSRQVSEGTLFFALKGEKSDGHDFLEEISKKGAVAAVVSKSYIGADYGLPLLRVDHVLSSLQLLAQTVHAARRPTVVGVTGSVGKTTTKEFIATLLEGKFRAAKTPGNANSQVGLPLSILNADENAEVFVAELGMSQPKEMEALVAIIPPDIALVTKIALAHVLYFPNGIEGIAAAKAEIFSHPRTTLKIVNDQVEQFSAFHQVERTVYGLAKGDYHFEGTSIVERGKISCEVNLPFTASHLRENFLGAVAVARALGMTWDEIAIQTPKLKLYQKRFELIEKEGILFVNDSYNANAVSMKAALSNLPVPQPGKKRVGVLGAMKELGTYEKQCHTEVAIAALEVIDHLLCYGEECRPMIEVFEKAGRPCELFMCKEALKNRLNLVTDSGDVVLLKGSKSLELWTLI